MILSSPPYYFPTAQKMKRVKTEDGKPAIKRLKKDEQTTSGGLTEEKVDFKVSEMFHIITFKQTLILFHSRHGP